ncbi:MAG: hypothetical protein Q9N02_01815 [Ghiorsea sp.]|nr:hypothetical protein [Ghiorsea sp.]
MKNILGFMMVVGLAWLTWQAWFPPATISQQADVKAWLAERPDLGVQEDEKWRVFTRRMVWSQAVDTFRKRLKEKNIEALVLERKEEVMLHVFDDPRSFTSFTQAANAKKEWHIEEVDILKRANGQFYLGLGRFYLTAYAERREKALNKTKKAYNYKQRRKVIPTYRFIFPPLPEKEAEILWNTIQEMGAVDPVMMTENEFNATFVGGT